MLSPFECLCGNFILPEPASYVFFYAVSNLHKLLYIIYTYDAWGNPLTTTGTMADTLGELNPFRYKY